MEKQNFFQFTLKSNEVIGMNPHAARAMGLSYCLFQIKTLTQK